MPFSGLELSPSLTILKCWVLSEILPCVKVLLVANAHPLQVDPGIGFLCTLEGFSFVSGWPFPDGPLVGSWPVLSSRARDGFDVAADQRNDFPVGHGVVNVPCGEFNQSSLCLGRRIC